MVVGKISYMYVLLGHWAVFSGHFDGEMGWK